MNLVFARLVAFARNDEAQDLIEYGLLATLIAVLCVLPACGLPTPPNANPCERAPGTQECQIWMYHRTM